MARGPLGPRVFSLLPVFFSLIFSLDWWWRGWAGPLIFFCFICCKLLARWYTVGSLRKDREMTNHNGWTNYATSRVYNEIFKYMDPYDNIPDEQGLWPRAGLPVLTLALREYVQDLVYEAGGGDGNIAVDYALAFLSEVNWFEIAESLFLEYADAEDREEYKKDCTNSVNNVL
jgi:hypothetical protein